MKKIIFISSGGGHLEELLKLEKLFKKCDFLLVSEYNPSTIFLKNKYSNTKYLFYATRDQFLKYMFIFPINIIISLFYFLIYNPDYVISTGTHTAVPMLLIAKLFKKKTIYIETFANRTLPTKTGQILYKKVDLFIVQWEELLKYYPDAEYWGWIY